LTAKQRKKMLAKQKEAFVTQASKSSSALGAGWSNWTPFASCSGVCGAGSTLRRRFCKNAAVGSSYCPGAAVERKECTVSHLVFSLNPTSLFSRKVAALSSSTTGDRSNTTPARDLAAVESPLRPVSVSEKAHVTSSTEASARKALLSKK
jgi:hypothetical protein